ncbi:glycoside hydrolase [Miniimonas arenae]|uniref:beta-galactosidase n=1 Tax=Miniimonas arenae TaxID=676201 RepID=A0A5C5BEY0_9MICO|nr:glycoside hydrolase [Miniimonas arenae]
MPELAAGTGSAHVPAALDGVTHETVAPPVGIRPARFRPPTGASSAETVSLDGDWRFRLFPGAETGADPADDGSSSSNSSPASDPWDILTVPGHWQLAGAPDAWPYGKPAYTNVLYPIPLDPPRVPRDNPTGEYRRTFDVPESWLAEGRVVLRFEGVDSWFTVAVNGTPLAVSHGSRLPTEIDVTEHVRAGANLLAVRVTQWSAFTYVEDQDQWWLSGIFRSVSLEHRPVGGIEHVRVSAEYDHTSGEGTLRVDVTGPDGEPAPGARVTVAELGIEVGAGEEVTLAVDPWSAEVPRLYDASVTTDAETVALRIGFRTVSIVDGVFLVNGAPVKLKGVNRHEFEPTAGRTVSPEQMRQDVLLMKRHHVNAVRTSHYPPHPHFLDLCDEYGLYVVDENDLETHGFIAAGWRGNPTDDPAWTDVLVDRVTRMVHRDAHHASIILWSLGNEAGEGRNLAAMSAAIRALDPSRPIHYEGDWSSEHVDVYSRMYASTQEVALIGRGEEDALADGELDARRRGLPFMQCEYVHAMGNGPGGFTDYDDLFDAHPRLMGGFVWEWKDHGISRREDLDAGTGETFYGYGGDFGETFHDGTFIADGLLLPDRTPSPGMVEMAAVYAPVRVDPLDVDGDGVSDHLLVRNRYTFRDTAHVRLAWSLHQGHEVLAAGELDDEDTLLAPGEELLLDAPEEAVALAAQAPGREPVWWTVRAVQRANAGAGLDAAWLDGLDGLDGEHVLGAGQLLLRAQRALPEAGDGAASQGADGGFAVGPARFDRAGRLTALGGVAVRTARVDAWRASTDNDHAKQWEAARSDEETWYLQGLALLTERLDTAEVVDDAVVVSGRVAGPATEVGLAFTATWRAVAADAVDLDLTIVPEGQWLGSVPRLGLLLGLEQPDPGAVAAVEVDWAGLGPEESYADSTKAALGGAWRHTVADWQTRYTHPQENGARRGVTSATLTLDGGRTLDLEAADSELGARTLPGLELTLRPWTDQALHAAAHPHDLVPDGVLWVHLDVAQHGVGTAACGPGVLANAALRPAPARLRVRLTVGG